MWTLRVLLFSSTEITNVSDSSLMSIHNVSCSLQSVLWLLHSLESLCFFKEAFWTSNPQLTHVALFFLIFTFVWPCCVIIR
jgi:hypothetical protein